MKKIFLIVSFLFLGISTFSQTYKPLLDNLNEWHVTSCYYGCLTDVYYTDGDTVVNNTTYKILDGYHYISRTFLLREEIENKKVYLYLASPGYNEEYLLYDFSLNEGDYFEMKNPISPFPQEGGSFVVDSIIPRPLEDGNTYKHFYFSPAPGNSTSTNNAEWIEGVGSLSIINAPGGKPDINGSGHLSCFFKDTEIFYANLDSIEDCIPLHLGVKTDKLRNLIISKGGTDGKFILSNTRDVKKIQVFNLLGKHLKEINNNGVNKISIDLSEYQNGLYIILATGEGDTRKSFKLIN